MEKFLKRIEKEVKTYGDLVMMLSPYYVCDEILRELKDSNKRDPASLAEFMISFKELWEQKR